VRDVTLVVRLFDDADIASDATEFRRSWNGFLRLYNFLQFLPRALFVTTQGLSAALYAQLPDLREEAGPGSGGSAGLQRLIQLTDPAVHDLLRAVEVAGKVLPTAGYELTGADGAVLATAELAWPVERLAVLLGQTGQPEHAFLAQNWIAARCGDTEWMKEVLDRLPQKASPATHGCAD
jgi:DEAD/DEAH box helicase domain-containing protein